MSGIDNVGAGVGNEKQFIDYTPFNKVSRIRQGIDESTVNRVYDIFYGLDEQRIKTSYDDFAESDKNRVRYYFGTYEKDSDTDGNITNTDYIYSPVGLIAIRKNNVLYYVHTDLLGSIERITNASGAMVSEYAYTPWGGRILLSGVNITDRGYTGHEHLSPFGDDTNSGFCLINMNGRIYDPVLARFLSPDPYVQSPNFTQSFNRYSYCWNNPFKYTDPSGELTWNDVIAGISFVGGIAINIFAPPMAWLGTSLIVAGFSHFAYSIDLVQENEGMTWNDASNIAGFQFGTSININKPDQKEKNAGKGYTYSQYYNKDYTPKYSSEGMKSIGELDILQYNSYYNGDKNGVDISLGYIDGYEGFTDFNYVQTIRTNKPLGGANSPYNDPQPGDDDLPFYWTNAELQNFTNKDGYDVKFYDTPKRLNENGTWWSAELSVVGRNTNGKYVPLYTISYGFKIVNNKLVRYPITIITQPSEFHINSF